MPKPPRVTPAQVQRALIRGGWIVHGGRGGHTIFKRPDGPPRRVTLAMHRVTIKPKTLASIIKQSGLTLEEFIDLL